MEKTETYAYNKRGQLTLAKNQHCEVTRQYNQIGMLILENQQQQDVTARLEYVYNLSGQLSEQHHQLRHHSQSKETAFREPLNVDYKEFGSVS